MKISINQLRKYITLPKDWIEIRDLMEDVGIEVKGIEQTKKDTIFSLELLANRGDHFCYMGVAREIYGRTGWKLLNIELDDMHNNANKLLSCVETDSCFSYSLTEFFLSEKSDELLLTENQKEVIEVSGTNLVLPVVDLTNYINLEMGQPLHVYDADKIDGRIIIRDSRKGESATLLFTQEKTLLPEGTLVVADQSKILSIAGVMGCEECKPTVNTKRVYLESGTFDPIRVRKSSKQLKLQSFSSMRFERGADPELVLKAVQRAKVLFKKIGWELKNNIEVSKLWKYKNPAISFCMSKFNQYFDTNYEKKTITELLERYGFKVSDEGPDKIMQITVPSSRLWDIKQSIDLYEEIAKCLGYNNLPSSLPPSSSGVIPSQSFQRMKTIERLLVGQGFFEVFTDVYYSNKKFSLFKLDAKSPLNEHVTIANAMNKAYSLLKNNTILQALELVQVNLHAKNPNVKAFEWTRIFYPNKIAPNGLCDEIAVLWGIVAGESRPTSWNEVGKVADVFYLKGLVTEISNLLSLPVEFCQSNTDTDIMPIGTLLHPSRRASLELSGRKIGVIGEIHPAVLSSWGIKNSRPCFMQLSQDILDIPPFPRSFLPPPNLNNVSRDICILLINGMPAQEVAEKIKELSSWVDIVRICDIFNSEVTNNRNAVTFSITYSLKKAEKEKFTVEDINKETERIYEELTLFFGKNNIKRR